MSIKQRLDKLESKAAQAHNAPKPIIYLQGIDPKTHEVVGISRLGGDNVERLPSETEQQFIERAKRELG